MPRLFLLYGLKDNPQGVNGLVDKYACQRREVLGILGSVIAACAALTAVTLNLRMALQVVGQAVGDNGTLLDDIHVTGHVAVDFVDEQGVVGAA